MVDHVCAFFLNVLPIRGECFFFFLIFFEADLFVTSVLDECNKQRSGDDRVSGLSCVCVLVSRKAAVGGPLNATVGCELNSAPVRRLHQRVKR